MHSSYYFFHLSHYQISRLYILLSLDFRTHHFNYNLAYTHDFHGHSHFNKVGKMKVKINSLLAHIFSSCRHKALKNGKKINPYGWLHFNFMTTNL